jgi:CubicO group peptidase (beta-lactamase class C family)
LRYPDGTRRFLGASPQGLYEIGSITKALTGLLLADASRRGELTLDDPVDRYVNAEQAPIRWPDRPPTLTELATHRAGLPNTPKRIARKEAAFLLGVRRRDPWEGQDRESYRRALAETRIGRQGRFRYSSIGFDLLGRALEAATGRTYE